MKTTTIASHYVRAAIAGALLKGYSANELLEQAGIGMELLSEPKARVYPDQFSKLLRVLVTELNDEFLGQDDKPSRRGTFETLCHLIIHSASLGDALTKGTRYYGLFDMAMHTQFERTENTGILVAHERRECLNKDHYLTEYQLVLWHRLACWLTGKRIPIKMAEFDYPRPAHADEYQYFFYGEHRFEQSRNQISIDSKYLDLPIIRSEQDLEEFFKEAPYVFLVKPNNTASINAQIRQILERGQENEMPDFESIAYQLNTSTQTLRRRLKDENTSFQEIKDQVRRDMAIYHLTQNKLSINEIALKVGFTEPSTFHRAFKKWTGVTPGDYRQSEVAAV